MEDTGPLAFARAMGAESVHEEDRLLRDLPMDPDHLARLEVQASNQDVPTGELDYEAVVMTPERIRTGEERLARSYDICVAAARLADGGLGGYSLVHLPRGSDQALQDETLVMPEHRGHRLGLALKLATYAVIAAEHPERTTLHTWTTRTTTRCMRPTAHSATARSSGCTRFR